MKPFMPRSRRFHPNRVARASKVEFRRMLTAALAREFAGRVIGVDVFAEDVGAFLASLGVFETVGDDGMRRAYLRAGAEDGERVAVSSAGLNSRARPSQNGLVSAANKARSSNEGASAVVGVAGRPESAR